MNREQIEAILAGLDGVTPKDKHRWLTGDDVVVNFTDTIRALCELALEGLEAREQRQSRVEYTKSARRTLERKPE